jgi:hypothetical protein
MKEKQRNLCGVAGCAGAVNEKNLSVNPSGYRMVCMHTPVFICSFQITNTSFVQRSYHYYLCTTDFSVWWLFCT